MKRAALKRKPQQRGVANITGICQVREVGSKGEWDVLMFVELDGSQPDAISVRSFYVGGSDGSYASGPFGTRDVARAERDRVIRAMNSGEVVWAYTRGFRNLPEKFFAKRDFGYSAPIPKKFKVTAKRLVA